MPPSLLAAPPPSISSLSESFPFHSFQTRSCRTPWVGLNLRLPSSSHHRARCGFPKVQALVQLPTPCGSYAPGTLKSQDFDPTSMLLKQRIIFLGSQVDDFSADVIISQMLLLDADDPTKDIKLFINSPGGSVTAGMGIYDAIKLCKADVSTVCFGLAASMGAFLLASGTKGKRFCMPNARVMIHQPLGGAQGSAIEVGLQVREMMYHKVKLTKIMSRLTGKSEEQLYEDEMCIGILDVHPLSHGHSLIIPKAHFQSLEFTPPEVAAAMCAAVPLLSMAIMEATNCESFNLLVNSGKAAGQVVFHTHFHIIPRRLGDDLWRSEDAGRRPLSLGHETSLFVQQIRHKLSGDHV